MEFYSVVEENGICRKMNKTAILVAQTQNDKITCSLPYADPSLQCLYACA